MRMASISGISSYYDISSMYGSGIGVTSGVSEKTEVLETSLNSVNLEKADDEELMEVCESFEAYFVEQVMKEAKKTVLSDEDEESEYLQYFGDILVQEYSTMISESGDLGIARNLYDSMKRNGL